MSQTINLENMPMREKFLMLEELWENMSQDAQQKGFTPSWHLEVLEQREEALKNGDASFSDLEDAKLRLQKLV